MEQWYGLWLNEDDDDLEVGIMASSKSMKHRQKKVRSALRRQ